VDLGDPTEAALLCADAFDRAGFRHAVFGGLALAAYGEPRETRDVDLAVVDVTAARARAALEAAGVSCIEAFEGVTFGGLVLGRVTLLGRGGPAEVNVLDLVTPRSPRYGAAVLDRAATGELRGRWIRVVSAEDYLILKALATRDKDLDDAASVLRRIGGLLDLPLVEEEVAALAAELPDVDVRGRWDRIRAGAGI
jgi:predicted nucleotidyltransferase